MPSKKERLKKKHDNIAKRKARIEDKNDSNISKNQHLKNKRTFMETLEKGNAMLVKAQKKYDFDNDDNVIYSLIYNSIITKIGEIVNEFEPIQQRYNTINDDIPSISTFNINLSEYKQYEYKELINTSDVQFFNDNYNTDFDNTLNTMSLENLTHLDFLIQTLIVEYYGLDDNSQYVQNYIEANSKGDSATNTAPKDDLNEIVREQVERAHNDPDRTFELISNAYENMAAEKFDNSEKVESDKALNKHQHKGSKNDLTPQQVKNLRNK